MSESDEHTLTVEVTSAHLRMQRADVTVVSGPDAGLKKTFEGTLRVGSRPLADLVLRDPKVSALHLELSIGSTIWARDLGSKNGTMVGPIRVASAEVPRNELIRIGDTKLRVLASSDFVDAPLSAPGRFYNLRGRSPAMRALFAQIERLAPSRSTVLIQGETGSGKERVAEALHLAGPRSLGPLEVVDCGALPPSLIESELFGHVKGAFTDATADAAGAFERANGGTLFLDEVGELPLSLQPKLLRVLETREVRRLGGTKSIPCDVRVVAATNRDLAVEVAKDRFREDLYYRLAVVTLVVPPLRDRLEDIPELAQHIIEELGEDPQRHLAQDSVKALMQNDWPGNVRQLRNTLERAVTLRESLPNAATDSPARAARSSSRGAEPTAKQLIIAVDLAVPLRIAKVKLIDAFEREYVGTLLARCNGNLSKAARRAGMDRMSIHRIAQRLGLRDSVGEDE